MNTKSTAVTVNNFLFFFMIENKIFFQQTVQLYKLLPAYIFALLHRLQSITQINTSNPCISKLFALPSATNAPLTVTVNRFILFHLSS